MSTPGVDACQHCGADWAPHQARGLCRACYWYQWRRTRQRQAAGLAGPAAPRPRHLWDRRQPRRCVQCQGPLRPKDGQWCAPCRNYRSRTGRARPARLWGRVA